MLCIYSLLWDASINGHSFQTMDLLPWAHFISDLYSKLRIMYPVFHAWQLNRRLVFGAVDGEKETANHYNNKGPKIEPRETHTCTERVLSSDVTSWARMQCELPFR